MSLVLQNAHFSHKEFSDKLSNDFLETYLKRLDPTKIFFTQGDVDSLRASVGNQLDDYLLAGQVSKAVLPIHNLFSRRVEQRIRYAEELLAKNEFTFTRDAYTERSRRKLKVWPKDEQSMRALWGDLVEDQVLTEILRRESLERLAKEQGKPNPVEKEKPVLEKIKNRYERILRNLKEYSDREDIISAFLSSVSLSYDPHTDYMGARETERFKMQMGNSLIGIGALLESNEDDGSTKIGGIVVGGPADKCGELKLNDRIVAVDTLNTGEMTDILYMKIDKVVDLIRGKEKTQLRLKIEPASSPGQTKIITLTRSKVDLKEELAKGLLVEQTLSDGTTQKLGVLTLPSFYMDMNGGERRCSVDVRAILERMVKEGVTGLVIDLRSNGGGSLEEVRLMTGFFTGKGPVVQIKDSQNRVETKASWDRRKLFDGQVVVLANKASASASEILAAALQDYGRAVIVGDTSTFGKGSVQQPLDMARFLPYFSDGSRAGMLKITTQKFYRVAGGSTQLKGVESDIVLPTALSAVEYGESKLDHAMPYDEIQPSRSYTKDPWIGKILPFLKERSGKRVAADRDFAITQETIARVKKLEEENKTSLNMEIRKQENKDLLDRRAEIDKERKVRFAEMAQSDAAKFKLYRMTLDDLKLPQLPQSDPKKDNEQFMKLAEDPEEKLVDTPTYPSGLDPELRECLNIVSDMVLLKENKELPPVK